MHNDSEFEDVLDNLSILLTDVAQGVREAKRLLKSRTQGPSSRRTAEGIDQWASDGGANVDWTWPPELLSQ